MKFLLIMALLFNVTFFGVAEDLASYNGTQPIMALFGDPIAPEWFTKSYELTYDSPFQYWGQAFPTDTEQPLSAAFVNESEAINALVISGIHRQNGSTQNFLVQIPSMGVAYLDTKVLRDYSRVFFISMAPFKVFFNEPISQGSLYEEELRVTPPIESNDRFLNYGICGALDCKKKLRVTNGNGPGIGGYALAIFKHYVTGVSKPEAVLEIFYPTEFDLFHQYVSYRTCDIGGGVRPPDRYRTEHVITGRSIYWSGTSATCQKCESSPSTMGRGTCQDPDCMVMTPSGLAKAFWVVSCENVVPPL